MSGSASEAKGGAAAAAPETDGGDGAAFIESDSAETVMTYNEGSKTPRFVLAVWTVAILSFIAYMVVYALPDLRLWLRS